MLNYIVSVDMIIAGESEEYDQIYAYNEHMSQICSNLPAF